MEAVAKVVGRIDPRRPVAERAPLDLDDRRTRVAPDVPKKFQDVRFRTSEDRGPQWRRALRQVEAWMARAAAGEPGMLALIGPTGVGKSHLLYCAAWELWEQHDRFPAIFRWYEAVDDLRDRDTARKMRDRMRGSRILMLDECRPTSGTDFDATELAKLSFAAYDDDKPVLLTCNWATLAGLMGEPAADRYTQIVITGESARG